MASGFLRINGIIRNYGKFDNIKSHEPATQLWKSVTSVSNAGKRRGRGKVAPRMKDLNRGQIIGMGKIEMILPGLNAAITEDNIMVAQSKAPPNPKREKELLQLRTELPKIRAQKIHPLLRGWHGTNPCGRKLGPPDPINEEPFHGFESWVIDLVNTSIMTSHFGRSKRTRCTVVTGNQNGLVGFASAQGSDIRSCITHARNKAGRNILYFERYEDHTVLHDFFTQFHRTKIFVKQMPKGYGIKAHRIIKTICEAIGIKDLHARVEGSKNCPNIIKAFIIGLLQQKSYQQLANEKQLHLVAVKKENDYYPTVLASPATTRTKEEIKADEIIDFKQYVMDGRMVLERKPISPFFTKLPSYQNYLRKMERSRDHDKVRIRLRAEYGDICSFLADKYPEASVSKWRKHDKKDETAEAE
ncbi:Putative 28S ribosomal protein S5, mitochondrial [Dufourea novaeangliae]|uniref:Small ribosomal subunit protein uS5m n=1 Tax=Dufourea novaeangliae TaxID=178035 RepID=A0A154P4U7_DUFNO|nr:Putative 28S ribosomal protein S5, mitochondrial [Dufourea novaeangliae]